MFTLWNCWGNSSLDQQLKHFVQLIKTRCRAKKLHWNVRKSHKITAEFFLHDYSGSPLRAFSKTIRAPIRELECVEVWRRFCRTIHCFALQLSTDCCCASVPSASCKVALLNGWCGAMCIRLQWSTMIGWNEALARVVIVSRLKWIKIGDGIWFSYWVFDDGVSFEYMCN